MKISRKGIYFHYGFKLIRKIKNHIELQSLQFNVSSRTINLHHVKAVIISEEMVGVCCAVVAASACPISVSNINTKGWAHNPVEDGAVDMTVLNETA